ncbi:MAG: ABC transporter ATP-binding protein [candidate division NC10 bacterium]|nr:ABC transporter ATP-binding protein [candidate division NC10 bacterium]
MSEFIEAKDLKKSFLLGKEIVPVLKGVNLKVKRGEFVAIVGPSGVGKSTLLHLLGALDRPTSGEVLYENAPLFHLSDEQLASFRNQRIGFVFQFHHLLPELSALENTMMPALIGRMSREEAREEALSILNQLDLSSRLHHKPAELSGGEQQKVAVARALIASPSVILADEPTGNLDGESSKGIFDLLHRLNRERGLTIIMVTHNEHFAAAVHRRIRMADGRIVDGRS